MKRIIFIFIIFLLFNNIVFAQNINSNINLLNNQQLIVPEPLKDLWNTFSKIKFDSIGQNIVSNPLVQKAASQVKQVAGSGINTNPSGLWNNANNWFVSKIGVSLFDIIKSIINVFIWFLNLISQMLKIGLDMLSGLGGH
ncbi:MAG: hypothetical protein ACP5IC_00185 [Minisyncoccia bacterium]